MQLAPGRLKKPHDYFPFDVFDIQTMRGRLAECLKDDFLSAELGYVESHCMCPPYPWGQVIYYNFIVNTIVAEGVPGDFVEFGIGKGGTSVFLARLAKKYRRKFLAVDSFAGLPSPDMVKNNHYFLEGDYGSRNGVDNYEAFMKYKSKFDVDDVMHVEKAFFSDAQIPPEFEEFAFVHLDSDLYESVYDSLEKLWGRIPRGGVIAIDDFFHHAQGPARAVSDFFRAQREDPPLFFLVPLYAVLIMKGISACLRPNNIAASGDDLSPTVFRKPQMYCPRSLDGNYYAFKLVRECRPFVEAVEQSVRRIIEAFESASQQEESDPGLLRARHNAEALAAFLAYSERDPKSGNDILRYLTPLEDFFDYAQGVLCGAHGEVREKIAIQI